MGEPNLRIKTEDEVMLVEQKYWERFLKTGKIVDYLSYKNLTAGQGTAGRHKGETDIESDYGNRNGADCGTDWRI